MSEIVELLQRLRPEFHLKSGRGTAVRSSEAFFVRGKKSTDGLQRACHAIGVATIDFLDRNLTATDSCIETGAGWSTIVFAAKTASHIAVNPDTTANALIREFLHANGIGHGRLEFLEDSSDIALPGLDKEARFDFALVDGNHSFPYPIIDWHYVEPHLSVGSRLLIDDTHIPSVKILYDILTRSGTYKLETMIGKCAVFTKINEVWEVGWKGQGYNKFHMEGGHKPSRLDLVRKAVKLLRS
jgi:hypothetical protein